MPIAKQERKRKHEIKSSELSGEEDQCNRKAKSSKHKRLKRITEMEEGCSEEVREKRLDLKVSRIIKTKMEEGISERAARAREMRRDRITEMEEGCSKEVREKRRDRKVSRIIKTKMEEGISERAREMRAQKKRRKKKILHPDSPIPYRKPNPAFFKAEPPVIHTHPTYLQEAELALADYEKNQGIGFKLLHVIEESSRYLPCCKNGPNGFYSHIFFKAVPKSVDSSDLSPKTFFGELFLGREGDVVKTCCIMEPDDPGTKLGCGFCPPTEKFPHPKRFIAGHFKYQPPCMEQDSSYKNSEDLLIAKQKAARWLVDRKLLLNNPRTLQWVELALAYHAKEQGLEFENVEVVSENSRYILVSEDIPHGLYSHLFFKAKPRNTDLSPKSFFAELHAGGGEDIHVLHCSIVDPNDPGTKRGCGICPALKYLVHPASGYIAGDHQYYPPCTIEHPTLFPG